MTKKQVWRYRCDHCGKTGYSGGHIARHEKHCTMNDARECRACAFTESGKQQPMSVLVDAALQGLEQLTDIADGCPVCMLAAIRRVPMFHPRGDAWFDPEGGDDLSRWDFKAAMKSFWDEVNDQKGEYW